MHNILERILIAGDPGSGKSHLALTCEMGVAVIYSDRLGGDSDLQGLEEVGVHVYKVDPRNVRQSTMDIVKKLREQDIAEKKIRTVIWDSPTYNQKQEKMIRSGGQLAQMQVSANKNIVFNMMDVAYELFLLPCHIILLAHMKKMVHKDPKTKEIIAEVWQPDLMPAVLADVLRECSLMGYTWKKTYDDPNKLTRYGICFTHRMGYTQFAYIKAPNGWGPAEPANIRLLFQKLESEAETRRQAAIQALKLDIDQSKELKSEGDKEGE